MAVVINELEMTPAPTTKPDSGKAQQTSRQGPATLMPDMAREIEKNFQRKQERIHRLTSY